MSTWFTRLFGPMADAVPEDSRRETDVESVFESIIPIAGMYGLDFSNFDPRWVTDRESR